MGIDTIDPRDDEAIARDAEQFGIDIDKIKVWLASRRAGASPPSAR